MATPTQPSIQLNINNNNSIKSAARKLPIKRKTPTQQQQQDPFPITTSLTLPNPNSNIIHTDPSIDDEDFEDEFDDESQDHDQEDASTNGSSGDHVKPLPPFKFHRIWSESDEIRFLQGLLGCWSRGLVFPRDLNLFYDRFSESMPQPYTRSQLSEKLRRLRRKFRIMSARIDRGQDPNRLAPHDRDLLHLCTRLWDPKHASTSPFSAPDPASSGGVTAAGNKRRRRNPRAPAIKVEEAPPPLALTLPAPAEKAAKPTEELHVVKEKNIVNNNDNSIRYVTSKTVLDIFDGSLKEVKANLVVEGSNGNELSRKWQEQRIAELDVFARRLRLVLEQSIR